MTVNFAPRRNFQRERERERNIQGPVRKANLLHRGDVVILLRSRVQVAAAEPTNPVARAAGKSLSALAGLKSVNTREDGVNKQWLQNRGIILFKVFWVISGAWHVDATLGS